MIPEGIEFKRVAENEIHVTDLVTGGTWRVVAPHSLSEVGAGEAIRHVLLTQGIRPKPQATLTVDAGLRIQEPGETLSPLFLKMLGQELRE